MGEMTRAIGRFYNLDGWKSLWCNPPLDSPYLLHVVRSSGQRIEIYSPNAFFPKISVNGRYVKLNFFDKFRLRKFYKYLNGKYGAYESGIVAVEIKD